MPDAVDRGLPVARGSPAAQSRRSSSQRAADIIASTRARTVLGQSGPYTSVHVVDQGLHTVALHRVGSLAPGRALSH